MATSAASTAAAGVKKDDLCEKGSTISMQPTFSLRSLFDQHIDPTD